MFEIGGTATANKAILRFEVTDTGIGIPENKLDQLFKAFSQVDASTSRKFGGTGLGLLISEQLAHLMDGSIGVSSTEGKGSRFWFTVTLQVPAGTTMGIAALAEQTDGEMHATTSTAETVKRTGRILVAEDNMVNQQITLTILEKMGLEADAVMNGKEVLDALSEKDYDLILMDCQMPGMDGYEATNRIRESEAAGVRLPIIAITANAMKEDLDACVAAGMDAYLTKPLRADDLAVILNKWLPDDLNCTAGDVRRERTAECCGSDLLH